MWKKVLASFGITPLFVINYEKLRRGNTGLGGWDPLGRLWCWNLPKDTVLIGDEIHRAKSQKSQNAKILRDSKGFTMLLLSATLAQTPLEMRAICHVTGLSPWSGFYSWLLRHGCRKGRFGFEFNRNLAPTILPNLHESLFKERGGRIRIADLGDAFPETQISADAMDLGDPAAIQKIYDDMEEELRLLAESSEGDNPINHLTVSLRARQRAELLKIPGICSLAQDYIDSGQSVVIFTNFRDSLEAACSKLKTTCAIYGGQHPKERESHIQAFQSDNSRIIIVNIQAGGESISLHDVNGNFPRVALVCPTYSAVQLKQALGRVHRAGGLTKSLQRVLFAAGTIEEKVCAAVEKKITCLDLLNDGDLTLTENKMNEIKEPVSNTATMETLPAPNPGLSQQQPTEETPKAVEPVERQHSKHSPSSLATKAKCCGFKNNQNRDTSAADRGTLGHLAVEKESINIIRDDVPLVNAVQSCLEYLAGLERTTWKGAKHHREIRLQMFGQHGSVDHLYIRGNAAGMIDLKFAHNLYLADSPQFWAYTIGVFDAYPEIESVTVYVVHPFLNEVDSETFTRAEHYDDLFNRCQLIIAAAEQADPASFCKGRHCSWCARIGTCPQWVGVGMEVLKRFGKNEEKFTLPEGSLDRLEITDPFALAVLYRMAPIITEAAKGWRGRALELRKDFGIDIPGYDLAERRGSRAITDCAAAFEAIKDRVSAEELIRGGAVDFKIGELETIFAASYPRGEKGSSKTVLMDRLIDADAVSKGAPVQYLRELKTQG